MYGILRPYGQQSTRKSIIILFLEGHCSLMNDLYALHVLGNVNFPVECSEKGFQPFNRGSRLRVLQKITGTSVFYFVLTEFHLYRRSL